MQSNATHGRCSPAHDASAAPQPPRHPTWRSDRHASPNQSTTPALSKGKFFAAATALLIGAAILAQGVPRTASAAPTFEALPAFQTAEARMHDGVDWSRVAAAPVDTGATVGAYDR